MIEPTHMPLRIIHALYYEPIGSIRSCAEGEACLSFICSLLPMCIMPPLLSPCWSGRFASFLFALASSA